MPLSKRPQQFELTIKQMATIYENNEVLIETERVDEFESKINVNGKNLIWIESDKEQEFKEQLSALLDRFRI